MISPKLNFRKHTQPAITIIDLCDMVEFPVTAAFGQTRWQRALVVKVDEANQRALLAYMATGDNRVSLRTAHRPDDVRLVKKASELSRWDVYGYEMLDIWFRNFDYAHRAHARVS